MSSPESQRIRATFVNNQAPIAAPLADWRVHTPTSRLGQNPGRFSGLGRIAWHQHPQALTITSPCAALVPQPLR